jgi:pSer/pThr/pTyr-binding forkhead associated (FHA) protein
MKLSLIVLRPGKWNGKAIPVARSPFLIGRDGDCHLRPTSDLVSKRQCAIWIRGDKASIEDLNSTNGTLVNDREIKGEIELLNGDCLKFGPVVLQVRIQQPAAVNEATPLPPTKMVGEATADDVAAALLLSMDEEESAVNPARAKSGILSGDTAIGPMPPMELPAEEARPGEMPFGSSGVAKELLKQYRRKSKR